MASDKTAKRALMIARKQEALLRRVANIYPGPGGGMDPSPRGGGYAGPGGGKYIGPSRYAEGGGVEAYGGGHRPPGPDDGAPLHDLTGGGNVYPDDIYGPNAAQYYGHFGGNDPMDVHTLGIARQYRNRPSARVAIYRAVPQDLTPADRLATLEKQMAAHMRSGHVPPGEGSRGWYDRAHAERAHLRALPESERQAKPAINGGDWVTINPAYARDHGKSALNGKYKILRKTVRADEVYTNGDSIHEYGYWPRTERASGGPVPPFKLHSGAAKLIAAKGQAKATPRQYAAMPGIKPDELKHSNFDTLGSKALPREEVIKHLEGNRVPLEETQLGGSGRNTSTKFHNYQLPGGKNYREVLLHTPATHTQSPELEKARERADAATRAYDDALVDQLSGMPRLSDDAYNRASAEVDAARIALSRLERADKNAANNAGFRSGHWDEPNVIAHLRMSDRKGPNGEKVLHVEEVQSDWGQQGREKGFKGSNLLTDVDREDFKHLNALPDAVRTPAQDQRLTNLHARLMAERSGVPSGPYVDNTQKWTDLALKRVLHEAAHGGYDKVVVTPGEEQNKRYDLSKQVKNIVYFPDIRYLHATTHDGKGIEHNEVKPGDLAEHIGKEAADRILKQSPQRYDGRGKLGGEFYHELEGDDLKMGGSGMRGYYDNILPKRLQTLAQQHDPQAKVQLHEHASQTYKVRRDPASYDPRYAFEAFTPDDASLGTFESQEAADAAAAQHQATSGSPKLHSLDVTPQMRDSIKQNGFNQFKRGGDVAMRQRYADGGGADNPVVNKAIDLVSMFQSGHPMAAPTASPAPMRNAPTALGSMSVKSLSDAFQSAITHHTSLSPEERAANSRAAAEKLSTYMGKTKNGMPPALLTKNAKLLKSEAGYKGGQPVTLPDGRGVETTGLALAPAYQEGKFTTCPNAASCKAECLGKFSGGYFFAGGGQDPDALKGPRLNSVRKTQAMLREPEAFAVRLHDEIEAAKRMSAMNNNMLGVRLNVLSDINPRVHKPIFDAHPDVAFYDYTKNNTNPIAPNHHYTYSSTGVSDTDVENPHSNWKQMRKRLDTGSNVAMAFSHKAHLPETVHDEETGKTYKVVNGDSHDFRPLDIQPRGADGVIVGLRNKKTNSKNVSAHKTSNGFFTRYEPDFLAGNQGVRVKDMHGDPIAQNTEVRIKAQKAPPPLKTNDEAEKP